MPAPSRPPRHIRLVRLIVRLFPSEFRGDFGADMEADLADGYRDAERGGRASAAAFWWRTLPSMLRTGLRQHLDAVARDIRFALRSMARTPGFTAVALLMIALGTGANAAMFSVVDAVMLRSPFTDPDRIAIVLIQQPGHAPGAGVSLAQYRSLVESAPAFEAVGAIGSGDRPVLRGAGDLQRMNVECVTGSLFRVLGTAPLAGRTFTADEDRPGGPGAVVISYQFWQAQLGGEPDVIGRVLTLNGVPSPIVGIMPPRFGGPHSRNNNDGWLPLGPALGGTSPAGCNAQTDVNAFARIKPGLSLDAAAAQSSVSAGIRNIPGWQNAAGGDLMLTSLDRQTTLELRTPLFALLGAVGLVLLIACANVANLQLERIFGRRRELAVRIALGATRGRLVCQTLIENLLLCLLGCAAGLLAARWTLGLIIGLLPGNVPHIHDIAINGRILMATVTIACGAGVVVGFFPALQASSLSLVDDLRASAGSRTPGGVWIRRALVTAQIALSLTLLVGAALMVQTFLTLRPSNPGFRANDKLTASVRLQGAAAAAPELFFDRLFDRIRAIPGVLSVSGSSYLPMSGLTSSAEVTAGDATLEVWTVGYTTPNYFDEMGIPLRRGRAFTEDDTPGAPPVALVNEAFVRRVWPRGAPPNATVEVARRGRREIRQVVGVVGDTRALGGNLRTWPELYIPFAQGGMSSLNVIIRAVNPGDPRLPAAVRAASAAVDPAQVLDRLGPLDETLTARVARPRFGAWLLGVFAAIALLLAAVGLAASIAFWVAQRTREIGVRMALGADAGDVTKLVVMQGMGIAVAGLTFGLAGAVTSTRLLAEWLYGVTPLDLTTFVCSAVGMLAIAALASYLPARRATRIDPLAALRTE